MRGRGCSGAEPARGSQREGAGDPEAEPGFLHAPFVRSTAACGPGVARTFISALPGPGGRAPCGPGHKGPPGAPCGPADAGRRLRERRRVHGLAEAPQGAPPTLTAASPSAQLGAT